MSMGVAAVIVGLVMAACVGSDTPIAISDARIGQPTGPHAAFYFTATSSGDPDRLLGAETDEATTVEIHETVQDEDGTMGMRAVEAMDLEGGGSLILEPGAFHMMLVEVSPLQLGDTVDVTLVWERAGKMTIRAEVVDPADSILDNG